MIPKFIKNINWELLREQKEDLLAVRDDLLSVSMKYYKDGHPDASEEFERRIDSVMGIVSLIDAIQDYAVDELGKSEKEIFNI